MSEVLKDARGVPILPGDTVVYGFGVSRSIAMAEGVVEQGESGGLSLTPSGLVRVRIVRRSYASREKPVVAVTADRIVTVIKLPVSPLKTQQERARAGIERSIASYTEDLRSTKAPEYWGQYMPHASDEARLADYLAWCAKRLAGFRKKLRALDG